MELQDNAESALEVVKLWREKHKLCKEPVEEPQIPFIGLIEEKPKKEPIAKKPVAQASTKPVEKKKRKKRIIPFLRHFIGKKDKEEEPEIEIPEITSIEETPKKVRKPRQSKQKVEEMKTAIATEDDNGHRWVAMQLVGGKVENICQVCGTVKSNDNGLCKG
jgi:hypothetical protein